MIASQNPTLLNSDMSTRMAAMRRTLADDLKDRRFALRVDEIRLGVSDTYVDAGEYAFFNKEDAFPKVRDAIEKYFGLAFGTAGKDEVLRLIEKRPQPIQEILINALSECRRMAPKGEQTAIAWLNSVIDAAETDPWQERARAAVAARDWAGLEQMLTGEDAASRPAARLLRLVALVPVEEKVARINLLRRIQIAHPDDFWATYLLGYEIHQNYEWDEALRYLTAAMALRPRSAGAQFQLGIALRDKGRFDEAIDRQREVLRLDPKNTLSRRELALVLKLKGKLDEAITEFREVLRLYPASYSAHYNLSSALLQQGRLVEAEAEARGDPAQARLREPPWAAGVDLVPAGPACRGGDGIAQGARASSRPAAVSAESDQCAACARESGRGQETLRRLGRTRGELGLFVCRHRAPGPVQPGRRHAESGNCGAERSKSHRVVAGNRDRVAGARLGALLHGQVSRDNCGPREIVHSARRRERRCRSMDCAGARAREASLAAWERRQERQQHAREFRRYYELASKEIDLRWPSRPSHIVDQRIWDFRQEATEMLRIMEEKKQQTTDQEPTSEPLCM